jgi:hypothetical protein
MIIKDIILRQNSLNKSVHFFKTKIEVIINSNPVKSLIKLIFGSSE